ncbi:DUF3422 domain-containing protein [Roseovarius aquimarinus]|uniref:DUF3422 domain-containing protein n=1 Tax=Roseovarius aquimarinus TaxID=1229156 RepID=A0ABW7I2J3_9RHOB
MTSAETEGARPSWSFHPDRDTIVAEPHARPSIPVGPRDTLLHLGLVCTDAAHARLFDILGIDPTVRNTRHWMKQSGGFRLKLEQHTEFMSITLLAPDAGAMDAASGLLAKIAGTEGLDAIVLTRVRMSRLGEAAGPGDLPTGRVVGGIMRGGMEVRTSFVPDEDGFITYFVRMPEGTPEETGRRVQRLVEMETYRLFCLLGLPLARRTGESLASDEARLIEIVSSMGSDSLDDDGTLFEGLSSLLQTSNALRASTRFRFSASLAYFTLVQQRLTSLEETELEDFQTISGFVRSRLDPSMATIESTAARQKVLIDDLSQALSLLRTRIDLALNRDNQSVLKSLDDRNRKQVMIAQTVEGLSAVAITYYAVGLLSYILKAAAPLAPVALPHSTLVAISVPFVLAGVWIALHRLRGRWQEK